MLSYGENAESLSNLGLKRYRVVTEGWTNGHMDRNPIANTIVVINVYKRFLFLDKKTRLLTFFFYFSNVFYF